MKDWECSWPNVQREQSRCEGGLAAERRNWIWGWRSVSLAAMQVSRSFLWLSLMLWGQSSGWRLRRRLGPGALFSLDQSPAAVPFPREAAAQGQRELMEGGPVPVTL